MWKGILFVIAIIITFDIGKALIDSWNREEDQQNIEFVEEIEPTGEALVEPKIEIKKEPIWTKPRQWFEDLSDAQHGKADSDLETSTEEKEEIKKLETEESVEEVPFILDLRLPSEDLSTLNVGDKDEQEDKSAVYNGSSVPKEKKISLKAKPIVDFSKGITDIPKLEGASVDIKLKTK